MRLPSDYLFNPTLPCLVNTLRSIKGVLNMHFAKELAKVRDEKGYLQYEIADFLGIKRCSYSSYETGRRIPDLVTLLKICQFLDIPYTHFIDILEIDLGFYSNPNNINKENNQP